MRPAPRIFRVQFYNPAAQDFSGPIATVRIPQQPRLRSGRFQSNLRNLVDSPAGREGWYIYGTRDRSGLFTVQSLKPRSLLQLQPDQVIMGRTSGLNYIDRQNWRDTPCARAPSSGCWSVPRAVVPMRPVPIGRRAILP